jgi:hypothetical protein
MNYVILKENDRVLMQTLISKFLILELFKKRKNNENLS